MSEITIAEQPWGEEPGAALVAALMADLDVRYDVVERPDDPHPDEIHVPGARAAPTAAPGESAAWAVRAEDVARPRGAFLVAHLDGEAVACGALRPLPGGDPAAGIAEVKRMFTAPEARGRGAARAVLRALVDAARELGYRQVVLETGTRQPEAMALYVREGWVPLAPYGEYCGEHLSRCFTLDL